MTASIYISLAILSLGCLIAACSPRPAAVEEPVTVLPPEPPALIAPPAVPPPAVIVHRYHQAAAREPAVIYRPGVGADYVQRVTDADIAARTALQAIEGPHVVVSPAVRAKALAAVERLRDVVREGEGKP